MPRPRRIKSETGIYHVFLRGNNKQTIFEDDEDNEMFLVTLKQFREKGDYKVLAYCLMGNHVHLLMKTGEESIGQCFRRIGASYVYWYNLKYFRVGHLFQDRFKSKVVETEEYFYDCSIPNTEVLRFYKKTVIHWLQKPARNILYDLAAPLLTGDGEKFCEKLKQFVMNTLSFYDLKGEPENTYHMILLGMFAHLTGGYWIKSNRESLKKNMEFPAFRNSQGISRSGIPDICLKAKDKNDFSAVIEIKPLGTDKAAQDGLEQIEEKEFIQELISEGYSRILKISLAVDGKDIAAIVK